MTTTNIGKYKADLEALVAKGDNMLYDLLLRDMERRGKLTEKQQPLRGKLRDKFESDYQSWYTESIALIPSASRLPL